MRRLLFASGALAALLSAAPVHAAALDEPIATAPREITEFVKEPNPLLHMAQLVVSPRFAAIYGRSPVVVQYVPPAFLVTEEASPTLASGLTNSPDFDLNFDFRCTQGVNGQTPAPDKFQSCYNAVLVGNWSNTPCAGLNSAEGMPGLTLVWENGEGGGTFRFNVNNSHCNAAPLGTPNNNNSANGAYGPSPVTTIYDGAWHHMRFYGSVNKSSAANVRAGGAYIDGTQVMAGIGDISANGLGWTGTQTVAFATAPFFVNAFETTSPSQLAGSFQIANLSLDISTSPVVGSTNVPVNPISNWINAAGLPVDQGVGCAKAYGHVPTLCHNSANFLTDTGTLATDFTLTAQFASTVNNKLYVAAIAPGEVPDRPYIKGFYTTRYNGLCTEASGTCTFANANQGIPIDNGDLACFVPIMTGGVATYNEGFAISGYTTDPFSGTKGNGNYNNLAVKCKVWSGGAVPNGSSMGSVTLTWTGGAASGYGGGGGGAGLTLIVFGKYGAAGVTPTITTQSITDNTASATTLPFNAVTAPSGLSLIVTIATTYDWSFSPAVGALGPPTTSQLLNKLPAGAGSNSPLIAFEKHSGSGSVTLTGQGNSGNRPLDAVLVLN